MTQGMALMGAVVRSNGNLEGGAGATGALRSGTGSYKITFTRNIRDCILTASPALLVADSSSGAMTTVFVESDADVRVTTRNAAGSYADHSFHLSVFCPK